MAMEADGKNNLDYPTAVADIAMSLRVINRLIFETGVRLTSYMNINAVERSAIGEFRMVFRMEKLHRYLEAHPELTAPPTEEEEGRGYTAL